MPAPFTARPSPLRGGVAGGGLLPITQNESIDPHPAAPQPPSPRGGGSGLRAAVVAEARRWIGTPYHHRANLIGVGVDCARLLIEVYAAAGVIAWFDPGDYPPDWHLHRDNERYIEVIARFAREYDWRAEPIRPADVVVWRFGRTFSHGGVVTGAPGSTPPTGWPWIVHAFAAARIVEEAHVPGSLLDGREMRAFRPLGLEGG